MKPVAWNVRKRARVRRGVCVKPVDSGVSDGSSSQPLLTVDDRRTHTSETTHNRRARVRDYAMIAWLALFSVVPTVDSYGNRGLAALSHLY